MIELSNITLRRGERLLFEDLNLRIHTGHRVGLVGRNGVGKSSLFALLRGRLQPETGEVRVPPRWTIGYMAQESEPSDQSALEWVEAGDVRLARIRTALAAAERSHDSAAHARLLGEFEDADGYTLEARAGEILSGLGFSAAEVANPQRTFSGGWRIRLNLARTLMERADLLLLDEPTNHLDLDALLWLESWLGRFEGTLVLIAHDRDFLDATTDHTAHLENRRATLYRGGYSAFERSRSEALAQQAALARKQEREVRHIREFVDRFRAKASKARQVQSRLKALERLGQSAAAQVDSPYRFQFPNPERMSRFLLETEDAAFGYGDHAVLRGVRFGLTPGARIGILGRNGAGKTTFIKTLAGELPPVAGILKAGHHARIGYFAQHQLETLAPDGTPLGEMKRIDSAEREQVLRNHLGGWGFPGEMVNQRCRTLSGGEKARLVLALIAWQRPALLLLDEPTNHLDLDMRHALALSLQDYEGALLLVSHDREFMARTVDEYWLAEDGRIEPFSGDIGTYIERLGERLGARPGRRSQTARRPETARHPETAAREATASESSRRQRRQSAAEARRKTQSLRQSIKTLERRIETLSAELAAARARLGDPATYRDVPTAELEVLLAREGALANDLAAAESSWMAQSQTLEALDSDVQSVSSSG